MRWSGFLLALASIGSFSTDALAFSFGSPICSVGQLPLIAMSPTLSFPPPTGWEVVATPTIFVAGDTLHFQVVNADDPERKARGVLIWVVSGPASGFGQFSVPESGLFQPTALECAEWSLTHTSAVPKGQSDLQFEWTAPETDPTSAVIVRAFLIEDCDPLPESGCRSFQALTPFVVLTAALFVDGFEG